MCVIGCRLIAFLSLSLPPFFPFFCVNFCCYWCCSRYYNSYTLLFFFFSIRAILLLGLYYYFSFLSTTMAQVLTNYLAATDSRDKLIKGAGCFFKVVASTSGETKYIKIATAMSDCRCLMRMCSWLTNIQKISDALESKTVKPRDIIFILRFLMDGLFSLLDNVAYVGNIFSKNPQFKQVGLVSRVCLFYGYVAAVTLNVYDLAKDANIPNRTDAYLVLTRNTCDMVSCIGNVSNVDLGAFTPSFLGLISAIIASRELFISAQKKTAAKK